MTYITAGAAWGDSKAELSASALGQTVANPAWEVSRVGWTVGTGVEYALTWNWSLKGEYLYLDAGGASTKANFFNLSIPVNARLQQHIGRVGASYHF